MDKDKIYLWGCKIMKREILSMFHGGHDNTEQDINCVI
jgi:hypothetical protein